MTALEDQQLLFADTSGPAFEGSIGGGLRQIERPDLAIDWDVRNLCRKAYPGHSKGCPNYGKRPTCPPAAPLIGDRLNLDGPLWIAWNEFDLAGHVARMKTAHPDWSDRQAACCLYWQQGARRDLRLEIMPVQKAYPGLITVACPEACGVNVTETMRRLGEKLEWPPVNIVRQVAVLGFSKEAKP